MVVLLALTLPAIAGSDELQKQLNATYQGKVFTLRQFFDGNRLQFSSDGHLVGTATVGSWTVDGQIEIRQIHLQEKSLLIKGRRRRLFFDFANRQMVDTADVHPGSPRSRLFAKFGDKSWKKFIKGADIELDVALPSSPRDEKDVAQALSNIFLFPADEMAEAVPDYWKFFVLRQEGKPAPRAIIPSDFRVGSGLNPPHAQFAPNPEYSDTARQAGYAGTAVLWLVIDQKGEPSQVTISVPVGLGLDEKAVEAVSRWHFDPASKGGQPVPVQIVVEVTFRLY
jgi:TonB family protein